MTNIDNLNDPSEAVLTYLPPILEHYEETVPHHSILKLPVSTIARLVDLADWPHLVCDAVPEGEPTRYGVLVGEIDLEAWHAVTRLHPRADDRREDKWASRSSRSAPAPDPYWTVEAALKGIAEWFGAVIHFADPSVDKTIPSLGIYVKEAPYMRWLRRQSGIGEIGTIGGEGGAS